MDSFINRLHIIFSTNNVSICHGIEHAKQVLNNAIKAIEVLTYALTSEQIESVLLAALLHDADDRKFFPMHTKNENLRLVLFDKTSEFVDSVIQMVNLVSSSKNGDSIPPEIVGQEWRLIPRYADRLEAIGLIGIERCYIYSKKANMPLYLEHTPKPKTEEELWSIATQERYNSYDGNSNSMMDHYYDKLLRLTFFPIKNIYFDEQCEIRRRPLIDFVLQFGKNETITNEEIEKYLKTIKF
jgi:uncharacterized protein